MGLEVTLTNGQGAQLAGPTGTLPVQQPQTASPVAGQVKIATTGTAVALPAGALLAGIVVKSKAGNAAAGAVVGAAGLANTLDGTGQGFIIAPGESTPLIAVKNASAVYVNGTAGDVFSFIGA